MKKEINRVLGNSLRCILPSFWWKRLLGKMVDKIESAESSASSAMKMATLAGLEASDKQSKLVSGSNIKTINNQSILGSGNITIEAGDGVEQIIFYATENDAYPLTAEEIAHNVESMQKQRTAFLNNTPVSFLVSVKGAGFQICETPSFYLPSNNTDIPVGFYIVCGGSAQVMVTCNWDGTANVKDVNWIDSELSDTSKNPVQNKAIKAYVDEKVANAGGGSLSINELDITSPAQIQGIIAKVREGEHDIYWVGSDTQSSSCLSYYIYDDLSLFVVTDDLCMSIFDLQGNKIIVDTKYRIYGLGGVSTSNPKRVDKNSVMYRMIADGFISGTDCYLHYADNGKDYKVNQCEMTTVGSTTYLCISAVADGTIIKLRMLNSGKYYDSTTEPLISFDSELSDTSDNAVQNKVVTEALGILEEHLAVHSEQISSLGLSMATKEELNAKQNTISDLETIRSGAALGATALQSVPAEYITESELSAKKYATTSQLAAKQDTISDLSTIRSNASLGATAIQKVKTINGESLVGDGDVELFTKALYDNLIEETTANEEVYAAAVNDLNTRLNTTDSTLNTTIETTELIITDINTLTTRVSSNEEVTATSYNELNERINNNYQEGVDTYATKTALNNEVVSINTAIVENEEVIAATLNDLLSQIEALRVRVEQLENA